MEGERKFKPQKTEKWQWEMDSHGTFNKKFRKFIYFQDIHKKKLKRKLYLHKNRNF